MKILITGGAGFQGSHLSEALLKKGHTITIINTFREEKLKNIESFKNSVNVVFGSITDPVLVEKTVSGHDVVFHLAANINVDQSLKDPKSFVDVNVVGTFNILEAVRANGIRMIHASTCEVYGDGHDLKANELLDETAEMKPNSPYAATKAGADRLCYSYYKSFGVPVTIVRPFNIFGERQKSGTFGALIPILVRKAMTGDTLTVFGDGLATRDYLHVSDLVRAYELVLETIGLEGKSINFGSGVNTSVNDIATYIAKKFNAEIKHGPARPGEVQRFPADISYAKSLGFSPKISIYEGIDRYIDWVKTQS
ncbi:MAG: dTDP-glucose 4,6-dehydratase [Parcubacteria group bacterium CG2_30_44_11]|nr:MAG: dTDP-glucose 4,6-dehydratase [Parcubacteria group bacterium CG2_30_44_11]